MSWRRRGSLRARVGWWRIEEFGGKSGDERCGDRSGDAEGAERGVSSLSKGDYEETLAD